MFATLRAFLFMGVFFPFVTLPFAMSALVCTFFDRNGRSYAAHARNWGRLGILLAGVKVRVNGANRLPEGPVVVMSNHASNFDILALQGFFPRALSWIAKKELFDIPVFGHSMRYGGYIPLDRGDGRKALKSMDDAADQVRGGKSVIIFPEGTRTRDGKLLPFKRGAFLLALKAGVPVVPVTINGSFTINPGGALKLNGGLISLTIMEPITVPSGLKRAAAEEYLMEQVRTAIQSGLDNG